jgi:hypothetical protein
MVCASDRQWSCTDASKGRRSLWETDQHGEHTSARNAQILSSIPWACRVSAGGIRVRVTRLQVICLLLPMTHLIQSCHSADAASLRYSDILVALAIVSRLLACNTALSLMFTCRQ